VSGIKVRPAAKIPDDAVFIVVHEYHRYADCISFFAMTRVLIVEDSADVLYILKTELEWLGFTVDLARDGENALQIAEQNPPDVIVSDVQMPGVDGIQFVKRLRDNPDLKSTPAIALTGSASAQTVDEALAAGFTIHLTKPVEINDLVQAIERLGEKKLQRNAG
jgi:two-component system CheB/CheR fusion protein